MWQPGTIATLQKNTVYSYTHQKNGLTVLLCPVGGSSVTAYMRAVNAGSKDEAAVTPMGAPLTLSNICLFAFKMEKYGRSHRKEM